MDIRKIIESIRQLRGWVSAQCWIWNYINGQRPKAFVRACRPDRKKTAPEVTQRFVRGAVGILLVFVLCFSLVKLGAYVSEYISSRRVSQEIRDVYYAALEAENSPAAITSAPACTPETTAPVPASSAAAATDVPAATSTAAVRTALDVMEYPDNPYGIISSRFKTLQRQNSDIIGWLNIPDVIDEAVVQRDNTYYLRRDYQGYHNDNGAIFLEGSCDLSTRPYTLMLFGHNMKSGAMFGSLRSYENIYFYRNHAFVTFDTVYEDGRYVIFAVGTLSQEPEDANFVDTVKLCSANILWREEAIRQLKRISEISTSINVAADDQILLLVTCTGDDAERRVVAARRIRENETEDELRKLVRKAQ